MDIKLFTNLRSQILFNITYDVELQEFAGEDNSDLFLEEREQAIVQAKDEKKKLQMSVPGIIGPHEIPEEMQD